ncbi:MAG: SAM-dependent methyltransferase [Candidatus Bathyarchaeia archaeon]
MVKAKNELLFVIEHLEPKMGKWLTIEYKHASQIVGKNRLLFANVKKKTHAFKLSKFGSVRPESFAELFHPREIIILDMKASNPLTIKDFAGKKAVIVGGILGDHPPKGRTFTLITSRAPEASARNLGKFQFGIDGAIYMAKGVSEGIPLEEIPIKRSLTIKASETHFIHLPYAFPVREGKTIISQELIEHLLSETRNTRKFKQLKLK